MNIQINICPRASGKTTRLVNTLSELIGSVLIVGNSSIAENLKRQMLKDPLVPPNESSVAHISSLVKSLACIKTPTIQASTLLVDDYLFFAPEQMRALYNLIIRSDSIKNIIIYTTSNKLYDEKDLEIAKKVYYGDIPEEFIKQEVLQRIKPLRYNLLIHPDAVINPWSHVNNIDYCTYRTEILGRWLQDGRSDSDTTAKTDGISPETSIRALYS